MKIRLARFWKIILGLYGLALVLIFVGPLLGILRSLSEKTRLMAVFVPLSFIFMGMLRVKLPTRIVVGLVLGAAAGFLIGPQIGVLKPIGTVFLRLIFMVIVPLVVSSLFVGTQSLGDVKTMGRIGFRTVAFYLLYTIVGAAIGLVLVNTVKPGIGLTPEAQRQLIENFGQTAQQKTQGIEKPSVGDTIVGIVPKNIFTAMSSDPPNMLQIVFFALFMGVAITMIPGNEEKKKIVVNFFDGIFDIMLQIISIVIKIAPYAVFVLIADVIGQFGFDVLVLLAKYTLLTIAGLALLFASYVPATYFLSPLNVTGFLRGIWPVITIAFSTSSSAASLPVSMDVAQRRLGISHRIAAFMLPLGNTINMNGSALYQAISAVFIAQVYGIPLGLVDQVVIVVIATLSAVGAPGVPGASFMMLVIVLTQVGVPIEGVALILGVERILDMFRTVNNVIGDLTGAVIVAGWEKELTPPAVLLKRRSA